MKPVRVLCLLLFASSQMPYIFLLFFLSLLTGILVNHRTAKDIAGRRGGETVYETLISRYFTRYGSCLHTHRTRLGAQWNGFAELLPDRRRLSDWGWHCTPANRRNCNRDPRSCKSRFCRKDSAELCTRRCLKRNVHHNDRENRASSEMKRYGGSA